jgi:hypothetical protein
MTTKRRSEMVLMLALVACGNSDHYLGSTNVNVVDDRVEIKIFGEPGTTVEVAGQPPAKTPREEPIIVSLDGFPDGPNEIPLTFTDPRGKKGILKASFVKPPGAGKPYLRVTGCQHVGMGAPAVKVTGPFGEVEYCWVHSDGMVRLEVEAPAGGKLTADGNPIAVAASGKTLVPVDLNKALLEAPIIPALSDGAGVKSAMVALELVKGTQPPLAGQVEVNLQRGIKEFASKKLALVATGVPLVPGVTEAGASVKSPRRSLVYVSHYDAKHLGRATTVGEVDLVAVSRDLEARDGEACGPYGSEGKVTAPVVRKLVDIEVNVYDTRTGERVDGKTFSEGHDDCPMMVFTTNGKADAVESRPQGVVVERWLAGLIQR